MDHVEDLNRCIRSELSAIETYQQVLEKHHKEFGQHAGFQQLSQILSEHEDSLLRLQVLLQQRGGTPSQDSGVWGTWSKTIMGTAKLFGDKAALKALKEGEERRLNEYEDIVDDAATPGDLKAAVSLLAAAQQRHIRTLNNLIDT